LTAAEISLPAARQALLSGLGQGKIPALSVFVLFTGGISRVLKNVTRGDRARRELAK
jgi:hypothetical protein